MFIEKLTKKDLKQILKDVFNYEGDIMSEVKFDNYIGVRYLKDWYAHEVKISDFAVSININAFDETSAEYQNKYKAFMLNKFGDKYKKSFNENLKQKYESEMIK